MNERNEIGGDLQDEYDEIQEREEANEQAPRREPMTDEELDDWGMRILRGSQAMAEDWPSDEAYSDHIEEAIEEDERTIDRWRE